jgi:hypothetical protein
MGHFVNHPPPGVQPNVQVAAYDYAMGASGQLLRALKLRQWTSDSRGMEATALQSLTEI